MDKHAMGEFRISHCLNNKKHPRLFAKIIYEGEHCIDIFPVVRTSDNMLKRKSQWFFRNLFYRLYLTKIRAFNPTRLSRKIKLKMAEFVCLFLSRKNIIRLARWNETRFEKRKTNCYINLYSIYSMEKEIIKSEWVEELAPVEFEGREYMAFKNTHDYLTHLYGDYMTLPPEEERKPSHSDLIIEF
jgi:lipopolysaccharide cholinephosphotransferase